MKKIIPISCLSISLIAILLFFQACVKDLEKEGINNTTQYIGTVVEKSTMQPVAGVSVQITDGSHVQAVDVTDSNGRFTLRDINFDELDDNYYLWLDATSLDLPSKQEPLMGLGEKIYDYKNIILYDKTNVDLLPRIATGEIGDTLALSAKVSGNDVTFDGGHEISARGICYATHQTPTLEDSVITAGAGLGEFSVNMRNLTKSTTYYVRAYATNNIATTFGAQKVFTTQSGVATLATNDATNLTATTATISGSVSDDGGDAITVRGFCYAKTQEPTINDSVTTDGSDTGSFVRTLRGLEVNTTYYYRPYATNTCGTSYGPQKSFKTSSGLPEVTTTAVSDITATTAKSGGNISFNGGFPVTARGVCWNTQGNPEVNDNHTTNGSGDGSFHSNITGLQPGTIYFMRAYATNRVGTSYGEETKILTLSGVVSLTVSNVTSFTASSAVCGGNITDDGGSAITERGLCWSTSHNPTTSGSHASSGSGMGSFTITMGQLTPGTTYYVRAYAKNGVGTSYSTNPEVSFTTADGKPRLTTSAVNSVTATTAKCGGNITDNGGFAVTARGVCWNTMGNPVITDNHTTNGNGNGSFTSNITGLAANTTYHVRAYATNSVTTNYGRDTTFTTLSGIVELTVNEVTNKTATSATCGGNITNDGGSAVTERGICWSTSQYPTISGNHSSSGSGTGSFTITMGQLTPGTTYYVRAYATNGVRTCYSTNQVHFTTTDGKPRLTTSAVNSVTATTAICGGNITDNGGYAVTARGICWNTMGNPVVTDNHTTNGNGSGSFTGNMTGLSPNTTYHVRAYATNSMGTSYGRDTTFRTSSGVVTLTVNNVTDITYSSATCGGNITNDGGSAITERGICWSTSQNPTISGSHSSSGSGTGSFTITMNNLAMSTTYYVRAYATNGVRTNYSTNQVSFTTTDGKPIVTTGTISNVTATSAVCRGNDIRSGGFTITEKGLCWSTSQYPTISDNHINQGSGIGSFNSSITGLSLSTTYYVRAYATNSRGTAYGSQVSFTTGNGLPIVVTSPVSKSGDNVISGGNVTSDGGFPVTARGICYGTLPNPNMTNTYTHTNNGSGTGYFSSVIDASISRLVYVRAYATNANGTSYGSQITVDLDYLALPTFEFNGHTYRVAPDPHTSRYQSMSWVQANAYCENLTDYGYTDWKMPTIEQLEIMYQNRERIGGFWGNDDYAHYFSSTFKNGCNYHLSLDWLDGRRADNFYCEENECGGGYYFYHVRPIRVEN